MEEQGIVYTTGVFDILHAGHINILSEASKLGSKLVVGIQDDLSVYQSKSRYPILDVNERMYQIGLLPFVDEVIAYHGTNQIPYYKSVNPNVVVQGSDWCKSGDRSAMVDYLKSVGIDLVLIPYTNQISSTEIKRRILSSSYSR